MRSWLLLSVLGAGCAASSLPEAPSAAALEALRLAPNVRGCGDVVLAAANDLDTRAVFVSISGAAQAAHQRGRTLRRTFSLPSAFVSVSFETGTALTSATCVGAFPNPGPQVDVAWEVGSGEVDLVVRPDLLNPPLASVDATLRDVTFVDPATGRSFLAPELRFVDVGVGLYPP